MKKIIILCFCIFLIACNHEDFEKKVIRQKIFENETVETAIKKEIVNPIKKETGNTKTVNNFNKTVIKQVGKFIPSERQIEEAGNAQKRLTQTLVGQLKNFFPNKEQIAKEKDSQKRLAAKVVSQLKKHIPDKEQIKQAEQIKERLRDKVIGELDKYTRDLSKCLTFYLERS